MNYLAHGFRYLDQPAVLVGTALPDWLSVSDRRLRVRADDRPSEESTTSPALRALWAGMARHLEDDRWFHTQPAFEAVSRRISAAIRSRFDVPPHYRASFLGHVLCELLLDRTLMEDEPGSIDRYYSAMAAVNGADVEAAVEAWVGSVPESLLVRREQFVQLRFIEHYLDDELLAERLGQVARRAGLDALPAGFAAIVPEALAWVRERRSELLPPA